MTSNNSIFEGRLLHALCILDKRQQQLQQRNRAGCTCTKSPKSTLTHSQQCSASTCYYAFPGSVIMLCLHILQNCTVQMQLQKSQIVCRHYMTVLAACICCRVTILIWMTMLAACRHLPAPQRFPSVAGQRSSQGQYRTEQPPADIADSILTNPWTAALMQGDSDRPQLYSNSLALSRIGIGSWAPGPADAHAVPQPSLQAHSQSQQVPENSVKAGLSSSESVAASLHGSQEEDEHKLESDPDKQDTDSCSSVSEDGAGSVGGDRQHDHDHTQVRHAPDDCRAWQQDQSKPAGPMQPSASSAASDSQHPDASSDKGSSDKPRSDEGSSDRGCSDNASSGRGSSPTANVANAPHAQPACHNSWAAAFTNPHGEQAQGLWQHGAPKSEEDINKGGRQRGFAGWIGDFGHLEGPRFNKQQGRAGQAHMRSPRDQPPNSPSNPHAVAEVGKPSFEATLL